MDRTHFLELPYILAAQAQKHVTHNEALRQLDQLVHMVVETRFGPTLPPSAPVEGERHIIPDNAQGLWAGQDGSLASFIDNTWSITAPKTGWLVWVEDINTLHVFDGSTFVPVGHELLNNLENLGINAAADASNRLTVSAQSSLFNHDGNGHQIVINKATTTDTASLLFQSGYSGHAEFGLTGDDNWHVKVSPDGTNWQEALVVDNNGGTTTFNGGIRLGSSPQTLDHYEEGNWAPQLLGATTAGNPVYTTNLGSFVRIGKMVTVSGRVIWTSLGGLVGYIQLHGLPYPCKAGTQHRFAMTASWYDSLDMGTGVSMLGGFTQPGTTYIRLWGAMNAEEGINLLLNENHITETGSIYFNCTYMTE